MQHSQGPSKLLILTNSLDGSSDVLIRLGRELGIEILRFNVDLYLQYEIICNKHSFYISDPVGRRLDLRLDFYKVLWRKPFLDVVRNQSNEATFPILRGQLGSVLRTIIELSRNRKNLGLVEPYCDDRLTKLKQLYEAQKYFDVPEYEFSIQGGGNFSDATVAKPLGESSAVNQQIFFTTLVDYQSLERPGTWFVQTAILGGFDITGVYIDGKTWFYRCAFDRHKEEVDWRIEINSESQSDWVYWEPGESLELQLKIHNLMNSWALRYGRLDFILDDGGKLWFLECNPNGQFGWLDDDDLTLHKAFLASALK